MVVLWILAGIIGILVVLFAIAAIRTLAMPVKKASVELSKDEARSLAYAQKLSRMIQCETVSRRGMPEPEKFRGFHEVLAELFPLVFEKLEKIDIDGNLMMRWKGTDPSLTPLMLISHQDVVPAEGEWKYPPFSGTIADGRVWGRGAGDIKCGVMAFYQAAEELLKEGYTPRCDVYLASSCTEEIGGDGAPKMVQWLKDHNVRLFMLCDEGGGLVSDPMSGIEGAFAAVGIFEKGYGDLVFTARSAGGHSSIPPRNNPIARLARFETAVERHKPFSVRFSPAVRAMFENLAPYASGFALRLVMHNLWLTEPLLTLVMPALSGEAAAMLTTTLAFTMQTGSGAANVIPQAATVTANLRYIPHQGMEESNELMKKLAAKYGIETEVALATPPSASLDLSGEAYRITAEVTKAIYPNAGMMPYVVTGGTDSRFFGEVAENCVRFSPIRMGPEQLASMHGINENIECAALPPAVDYYKALIRRMEGRE